MSIFDTSPSQPRWTRDKTETTIAGFSIVSVLGLVLVGLLMAAPLLQ
jgi:hypothetical protein